MNVHVRIGAVIGHVVNDTVKTKGGAVGDGETQTGVVETIALDGKTRRVIRWRTKEGTVTRRAAGPTRYRTVVTTSPGQTRTTTLPGETVTVTLPGETVTQTNTETVTETVTEEKKKPPPKP